MKKLALPLVAALAVGACATSPAESVNPSASATPVASATPAPSASQAADEVAVSVNDISPYVGVFPDSWIAFDLDGSPADWTFAFSDPSLVEFHADGVRNAYGTFAGVYVTKPGLVDVTATSVSGETVEMQIEIIP
jgi:hypothetical protein